MLPIKGPVLFSEIFVKYAKSYSQTTHFPEIFGRGDSRISLSVPRTQTILVTTVEFTFISNFPPKIGETNESE